MTGFGGWPAQDPSDEGPAAWALGIDTLARASAVAAAATCEADLREGTAWAIAGPFADWVLVDLPSDNTMERSAATPAGDPGLLGLLNAMRADACPVIRSAIEQGTPVVRAASEDESLLGALPGRGPVARLLRAAWVAVGPVTGPDGLRGAITAVRCTGRPYLGFRELGVLSQIADLTATAAQRLRTT
jgi:GAF domain-containing protein